MPRRGKRNVRGYQKRAAMKAAHERALLDGAPMDTRSLQPDGIVRRGGARPGAGRPRGVPWELVRETVERTGASLEEVLALPDIPDTAFEDGAILARLRDVVERAQLVFRMSLRSALANKGIKKLSVTALLGLARNTSGLEFDKQTISTAAPPDVEGLEIKIDELLERLARKGGGRATCDTGCLMVEGRRVHSTACAFAEPN